LAIYSWKPLTIRLPKKKKLNPKAIIGKIGFNTSDSSFGTTKNKPMQSVHRKKFANGFAKKSRIECFPFFGLLNLN
jgi:hypothetical protein